MDFILLFPRTILLRPYVFLFLAVFLFAARRFFGWRRTWLFLLVTWITAFVCEFSSTRTGFPFGWYHYTGSTVGQELYLSNIPFMDSLSFTFLLYASYCVALAFLLPSRQADPSRLRLVDLQWSPVGRKRWTTIGLTTLLFAFIDIVIDPVALRGDRWFLGKIYYYPDPGVHFGVPIANYVGWAVVSLVALSLYFPLERRLVAADFTLASPATSHILLGCGLYYGVLAFNLAVTFSIDEPLLGATGIFIYLPITALLLLRLFNRLPLPS
jgi:putative membrane protein